VDATDLRFPVGKYFEDQVVMPRVALRAESYQHVPRVWVAYRQRVGSILASASLKKAEDMSRAMNQAMKYWMESGYGPPPVVRYFEVGSGNVYQITIAGY